jgi:hypothetical protein
MKRDIATPIKRLRKTIYHLRFPNPQIRNDKQQGTSAKHTELM